MIKTKHVTATDRVVHDTFTSKQICEYATSWGCSESDALKKLEEVVIWSE